MLCTADDLIHTCCSGLWQDNSVVRDLFIPALPWSMNLWHSHTLVEHLKTECRHHPRSAVAYYYCSVNDNASCLDVLVSFLDQLVLQADTIPERTRVMFSEEKTRPRQSLTLNMLMTVFREAFANFDVVYILLDALDEFSDLKTLMKQLAALQLSQAPQLHLLFTSQPHPHHVTATVDALLVPDANRIGIAEHGGDIPIYIDRFLRESADLQKFLPIFPDMYDTIKEILQTNADNSFVFIQVSEIRRDITWYEPGSAGW